MISFHCFSLNIHTIYIQKQPVQLPTRSTCVVYRQKMCLIHTESYFSCICINADCSSVQCRRGILQLNIHIIVAQFNNCTTGIYLKYTFHIYYDRIFFHFNENPRYLHVMNGAKYTLTQIKSKIKWKFKNGSLISPRKKNNLKI